MLLFLSQSQLCEDILGEELFLKVYHYVRDIQKAEQVSCAASLTLMCTVACTFALLPAPVACPDGCCVAVLTRARSAHLSLTDLSVSSLRGQDSLGPGDSDAKADAKSSAASASSAPKDKSEVDKERAEAEQREQEVRVLSWSAVRAGLAVGLSCPRLRCSA